MRNILFYRLISLAPTLFGLSLISFFLIRLIPGDPVSLMLGTRGVSPEAAQELREQLGLDGAPLKQYFLFLKNSLQGNLGYSFVTQKTVWSEFREHFPATLELGILSLFWGLLFGVPMGVFAALKRGSLLDRGLMGFALTGYSMPIFWWGLVLILFFSVSLNITPVSGRLSAFYEVEFLTGFLLIDSWFSNRPLSTFLDAFCHLLLPSFTLSSLPLAVVARMTRSSFLEIWEQDYIRTAKAKGLSSFSVVMKHSLKNALIPIVTVIGLMGGTLVTGAILTETLFSWPGVGRWIVNGVEARDYPVVQGGLLLITLTLLFINLITDLICIWINPQIGGQN